MGNHDAFERAARLTDRQCPDCGMPTARYLGSIHGWRCVACVAAVVGLPYRPADALPRDVLPGCDFHGRPILPMGRHRSTLTMNTEVRR